MGEKLTNKEKAQLTWDMIQKEKEEKRKKERKLGMNTMNLKEI